MVDQEPDVPDDDRIVQALRAKEAAQDNRRACRYCCGLPLALLAALIVMVIVWPRGCDIIGAAGWSHSAFDAEKWRANYDPTEANYECVRGRMVNSLLISNRLAGMTRQEVLELLGRPEYVEMSDGELLWNDEFGAAELAAATQYEYYLGGCSGFGIDPDYLVVQFADDGRVKNYWWRQS